MKHLASLDPIGIGTDDCESLSGYVQRLATANGTYPGQLVFRLLAWTERRKPEMAGSWASRPGGLRLGANNNCFEHADAWLRALQALTGRADLYHLTTRSWDDLFPSRGFQHNALALCPICLDEDEIPYHRLKWAIQPSTVCSRHATPLVRSCPLCGRTVPVLHDRSRVLFCPWCQADFRQGAERLRTPTAPHSSEVWVASEIADLVARSAKWLGTPQWSASNAFGEICRKHRIPNAASFGRFIGSSKLSAWYWLKGRAAPALPSVLRIYRQFGYSLARDLDAKDPDLSSAHSSAPKQSEAVLPIRRHPRNWPWKQVREALLGELARSIADARSFIEISHELKIERRTLRAHEPQICRQISRRFAERRREERFARDRLLLEEMQTAMTDILRAAEDPTKQNVELRLGKPGLFNRGYARRVFQSLQQSQLEQSQCVSR